MSFNSQTGQNSINIPYTAPPEEADLFDYQATVNELTIQFLSEFEETRVAALKWLIMLHQKAPKKVRRTQHYWAKRYLLTALDFGYG
jgi:vacuole morphology and inheritance protein 14